MPLKTRISLEAQRTIETAFQGLKSAISHTDYTQLKDTTLEDVRLSIHKIEEYLGARGWVRNLKRLMPLITGLGHYAKTIEVLCNGTPFLPWVWAPIKLILKVASDHADAFEQIIKAYASIAEPLMRLKVYDATFSKDREVQQALALYYGDILAFHTEAYKLVRRGGWHILFSTSFGRFKRKFQAILTDLEAHEDLVDKTANAAGLVDIRCLRENLQLELDAKKEAAVKKEEELTASQFAQLVSLLRVDDAHQHDILDAVFTDAGDIDGSGSWALSQPKIKSWASLTDDTKFLTLHGHPGTGKTVLSAQIAKFLQLSGQSLVITHFCTYLYPESTQYGDLLRLLIIQLIRQSPELITHAHSELLIQKRSPSWAALEQLLGRLVGAAAPLQSQKSFIHLIVDGLHECSDTDQVRVAKVLQRLVASTASPVLLKVLISTRTEGSMRNSMRGIHEVPLAHEKKNLRNAIQLYCSKRLESLKLKLGYSSLNDDDVSKLIKQIVDKADGMILWAKLVLQYIASNLLVSKDEVFQASSSFPPELALLYGQILSQTISGLDQRSLSRFSAVLGWVAFARRPLRQSELLSALSFTLGDREVAHLIPSYLLDTCAPLVERRKDTTYQFIHGSVLDFLRTPESPISLTESVMAHTHRIAMLRCMLAAKQILTPPSDKEQMYQIIRGVYGLLAYAVDYWLDYLMEELSNPSLADTQMRSDFLKLASSLANALGYNQTSETTAALSPRSVSLFSATLSHDSGLFSMSCAVMQCRQKTSIEPMEPEGNHEIREPRSLDQLKANYQTMIRLLLHQRGYEAISMSEFERFKHEARFSAFTCRLLSCPKSFVGFDNEHDLIQHESGHCVHICIIPGCQYPPFSSVANLRRHEKQQHEAVSPPLPKRTSIKSTKPRTRNATNHVQTGAAARHGSETPMPHPLYMPLEGAVAIAGPSSRNGLQLPEEELGTGDLGAQQQQPQQMMQPQTDLHASIPNVAKILYRNALNNTASGYGSRESVPHEVVEKIKHDSLQQAQALLGQTMVNRTMVNRQLAQQQQQRQQLFMQQQQNQQQQHMQEMGGMMGHQQM